MGNILMDHFNPEAGIVTDQETYDAAASDFIGRLHELIQKEKILRGGDRNGKVLNFRLPQDLETFEHIKYIQLDKYHKAKTVFEKETIQLDPVKVFHKAVENCTPVLILQRVERLGIEYRIPVPVRPNYQVFQAMKWLIDSANDKDKTLRMYVRLAYEIIEASNDEGKSVRKKQEMYRLSEQNKAYSGYRK